MDDLLGKNLPTFGFPGNSDARIHVEHDAFRWTPQQERGQSIDRKVRPVTDPVKSLRRVIEEQIGGFRPLPVSRLFEPTRSLATAQCSGQALWEADVRL